ncbi:MAG: TraC protein, partial [Enterococcus faecalis DORA_14]
GSAKISGLYVQQYQNNDSLVTQKDIANYFLDFMICQIKLE